jgi:uncharacterized protein
MIGVLSSDQIDMVLRSQVVGRLGCCVNGEVYVVPLTYVFHRGALYGHSREGKKIEMMRKNPRVCFEVDVMENMANWRSVIAWGDYQELKSEKERKAAMKIITDKFLPMVTSETVRSSHGFSHPPEVVEKGSRAIVYRIIIRSQTGRYEKTLGGENGNTTLEMVKQI